MEVRAVKPEEVVHFYQIQSIAYLYTQDFSGYEKEPNKFQGGYENVRAVFDDSGKLCAGLVLNPFSMHFDGSTVMMGGIGGVATLPEERRKGYVRSLFKSCVEEMYDKGYIFSYLFPFSYAYYKKFGYELSMTDVEYTLPFSALNHLKQTGNVQMFKPGMDTADVIRIYDQYTAGKNFSIAREEKNWKGFFSKDPNKNNVFTYIWYTKEGTAKGYLQCSIDRSDHSSKEPNMRMNELVWLSTEALSGMLAFMQNFSSQFHKLIIRIPHFEDLMPFFPEPYQLEQRIKAHGMNRVINVKKALELMRIPSGKGELAIEVHDDFFPRNTGKYLITWKEDQSKVTFDPEERESDLICDVTCFSQLVTGFKTVSQLSDMGSVKVKGDTKGLNKLFTKTQLFSNDFF